MSCLIKYKMWNLASYVNGYVLSVFQFQIRVEWNSFEFKLNEGTTSGKYPIDPDGSGNSRFTAILTELGLLVSE